MTTAIDCTAKLCAFRKTRDGVVASFVIHPNEVPEKLQTDPIGTSYVMALVEVDDATGQPKGGDVDHKGQSKSAPSNLGRDNTSPRPLPDKPAGGAKSYAQEAGRLCADTRFRSFLGEKFNIGDVLTEYGATIQIYQLCNVSTRRDIIEGTYAADQFNKLVAEYEAEKVMT